MMTLLKSAAARIKSLTPGQKVLSLILISLLVYGTLIFLDVFFLRDWIEANFGVTDDLHYYQERAQAILDGLVLYKDIHVESPPLINFLFVIPQAFGGEAWMYQVFFSLFPLMQAVVTYLVLRRWNDVLAYAAALFALLSPFSVIDATWGIQDEPIVTFLYVLPVLLLMYGMSKASSVISAAAFWTKGLPIITYPNLLMKMKDNKERLISIAVVAAVSLAIFLPIMAWSGQSFMDIFEYYMLRDDDITNVSGGISIIALLKPGGIYLPSYVGTVLAVAGLLSAYYASYRWNLDVWRSVLLTTVCFMCTYPMLRFGYFAIPFSLLAPWLLKGTKDLWVRFIAFYPIAFIAQGIESSDVSWLMFSGSWVVSEILMIIAFLLLIDMVRICMKSKCFLDDGCAAQQRNF